MKRYVGIVVCYTLALLVNAAPVLLPVTPIVQKKDYCGEASVAMILTFFGKPLSQDYVHDTIFGLSHTQRGAYSTEIISSLQRAGYSIRTEAHYALKERSALPESVSTRLIQIFKRSLDAAEPVIYGWYPKKEIDTTFYGHFSVIIGYDEDGFFVIDPRVDQVLFYSYDMFSRYLLLPTLDFKQWGYFYVIISRKR